MNILCLGGRTTGIAVAWDCVKSFLAAKFSGADRHLRRLAKTSALRTNRSPVGEFCRFPWEAKPRCTKETAQPKNRR